MTTHRLSLCVATALACLLPHFAAGATAKVDLSTFFSDGDQVGDFRVYPGSDGTVRRSELVAMGTVGKKVSFLIRHLEDGVEKSLEEEFLAPGKKLFLGDAQAGNVVVDMSGPKPTFPLHVVPGKPYRFKATGRLIYLGQRVGKAKVAGTTTFVGFEAHASPSFASDHAARIEAVRTLSYVVRGAPTLTALTETTSWVTETYGTLGYTTRTRIFQDGVLTDDSGVVDYELESGVFAGVPLP